MIGFRGIIASGFAHLAVAGWLINSAASTPKPEEDMSAAEQTITISLAAEEPAQAAEDAPPPAAEKTVAETPPVEPVPEAVATLPEPAPSFVTPEPVVEAPPPASPEPEIVQQEPAPEPTPVVKPVQQPEPQKVASIDLAPMHEVEGPKPVEKQKLVRKKPEPPKRKDAGYGKGISKPKPASAGSTGAKAAGSGGAAASRNYASMILARLRGARPSISGGGGRVTLSFTVGASGSLISAGASGGDAALKSAALGMVRNAAPFPAIPAETGKSSWRFTVPVQFD